MLSARRRRSCLFAAGAKPPAPSGGDFRRFLSLSRKKSCPQHSLRSSCFQFSQHSAPASEEPDRLANQESFRFPFWSFVVPGMGYPHIRYTSFQLHPTSPLELSHSERADEDFKGGKSLYVNNYSALKLQTNKQDT